MKKLMIFVVFGLVGVGQWSGNAFALSYDPLSKVCIEAGLPIRACLLSINYFLGLTTGCTLTFAGQSDTVPTVAAQQSGCKEPDVCQAVIDGIAAAGGEGNTCGGTGN